MNYHELSQEQYTRAASELIAGIEDFHPNAYDLHDGAATIGFGYTFNRNNNATLWNQAGIILTADEKKYLQNIDAAKTNSERTQLGLAFSRELTKDEATSLLHACLPQYEGPANDLAMPYSKERAALVAVTYNRNEVNVNTYMQPFLEAVKNGDRAEAWYQLRYESWGNNWKAQKGLRKGRAMEAQVFGLYDDPAKVTPAEAVNVYKTFQRHHDDIEYLEARWGVDLDSVPAHKSYNVVDMANRDYPGLTATYGAVPTITQALEPAKTQYLDRLRQQFPAQADQLTDRAFLTGAIQVTQPSDNPYAAPQLTIDESKLALHRGDRGQEVQALQQQLTALGYTDAKHHPLVPDGDFGSGTVAAISAFQEDHHLTVSGVADVATQQALHSYTQDQVLRQAPGHSPAPGQTHSAPAPNPHRPQPSAPAHPTSAPLTPADHGHPDHALNQSIRLGVQSKLASTGMPVTDQQLDNLTAALLVDARKHRMTSVDDTLLSRTGSNIIVRQGDPNDRVTCKQCAVNIEQTLNIPAQQSYQQFEQVKQGQIDRTLAFQQQQELDRQQSMNGPRMSL